MVVRCGEEVSELPPEHLASFPGCMEVAFTEGSTVGELVGGKADAEDVGSHRESESQGDPLERICEKKRVSFLPGGASGPIRRHSEGKDLGRRGVSAVVRAEGSVAGRSEGTGSTDSSFQKFVEGKREGAMGLREEFAYFVS